MWTETQLDELCSLIVDCPHATAPATEQEPFAFAVGTRALTGRSGRIRFEHARPVAESSYKRWTARATPQTGDIVLAREAPVGPVACISDDDPRVCLGQRTVLLRPDPEYADSGFLTALLRAPSTQSALLSRAEGSTVPHLNVPDLRELGVQAPPIAEQRAIADILNGLEDKIDSNERVIAASEGVVDAVFERQFGRSWAYSVAAGCDPAGGRWGSVRDLVELRYGKPLAARNRSAGPALVVGSSGVVDTHVEPLFASAPTIVVGRKGTAGSVLWIDEPCWPIDTTFVAVPHEGFDATFVYRALRAAGLTAAVLDSAVPGLNRNVALERICLVPEPSEHDAFVDVARPLHESITVLRRESRRLASIRDALLPRLISGRIRVPLTRSLEEAHDTVLDVAAETSGRAA